MAQTLAGLNNGMLQTILDKNVPQIVLSALLCYFCVALLSNVLIHSKKREWDSFYFVWMCLATFLWAITTFLYYVIPNEGLAETIYQLHYIGLVFLPGLLCLHIWKQVSYKEITWPVVGICLIVPVVYTIAMLKFLIVPSQGESAMALMEQWPFSRNIFYIYLVGTFVKSYLLLFNVFYQMPPHMRTSAYYMITGITIIVVLNFVLIILGAVEMSKSFYDLNLPAVCILLLFMYYAFNAASSANVIVTSRDFVFGSLSTMVLVLNRKMRILDWNKKTREDSLNLPEPIYRESFQKYRSRMLAEGNGRVSSHDNNIITTIHDDIETHYLITTHEVRQKKRQFGYLVEISEVTRIYTVFRYLEEIATIDQLTGLFNRNAYLNMVRNLVADEYMPLLVVVGDVNNLKPINDTLGHLVGDKLLKELAGFIDRSAPEGAFCARIGGDEFVMLMPQGNAEIAQQFIAAINRECRQYQDEFYETPSMSWGFAVMYSTEEKYNDVFNRADQMMYATKRNRSRFRSGGLIPSGLPSPGESMADGFEERWRSEATAGTVPEDYWEPQTAPADDLSTEYGDAATPQPETDLFTEEYTPDTEPQPTGNVQPQEEYIPAETPPEPEQPGGPVLYTTQSFKETEGAKPIDNPLYRDATATGPAHQTETPITEDNLMQQSEDILKFVDSIIRQSNETDEDDNL